jgi:hypothetical protein
MIRKQLSSVRLEFHKTNLFCGNRCGCLALWSLHVIETNTGLQEQQRVYNYITRASTADWSTELLNLQIGVHTRKSWFSLRKGEKVVQNFSMSALMSPVPLMTSINFSLLGASLMATCRQIVWVNHQNKGQDKLIMNKSPNLQLAISTGLQESVFTFKLLFIFVLYGFLLEFRF